MIPKIIHYCWFGKGSIPAYLQECIDTWHKNMPNYQFKCWSENNFNICMSTYVKEAYENKKYAFVSDYVRIFALYNYGGIYLDTDVIVKDKFDNFLSNKFVSGVEWHKDIFEKNHSKELLDTEGKRKDKNIMDVRGCGILAAVMMSEANVCLLKDILDYYDNSYFINEDGSFNLIVSPAIYAACAEKYGFRYKDEEQHFGNGFSVFPSSVFSVKETASDKTIALHIGNGSWEDDVTILKKISRFLKRFKITNKLYKFLKQIPK